MENDFDEIVMKEKERSLHISRVPKNTKDLFTELADSEFAGDYGMFLKWCMEQAVEYQSVKQAILDKEFLIHILESISQTEKQETKPEEEFIKTLDGKNRVKGGKK